MDEDGGSEVYVKDGFHPQKTAFSLGSGSGKP
jgi:hypothetical protein